jgi:hypothetical protein
VGEPAPLHDVALTTSALEGLESAAANRDSRPLSTVDILLGLLATNSDGSWANVQLNTRYIDREDIARHPDPGPEPAGVWRGVPLTATATASLQAAVKIAADYHLVPLPPGVLALGALSEPGTGACKALLDESDCSHEQLLELVQSEILEVDLENFEPGTPAVRRGTRLADRLSRRKEPQPPASVRSHDWITEAPGALDVLAEAVEASAADERLRELLASMLLESDRISALQRQLRDLPDTPADEVRAIAERRFGAPAPDPSALIVAAALSGSERVAEALRRLALTPHELAAQIAEHRLRSEGENDRVSSSTIRFTILNALFGVLASLLVIRASFGDGGHWWRLFFLWLVWMGHPQLGPAGSAVVAAVLAVLVSPLVGAVHLVGILADVAQARAERRTLLARTGVELSLAELRRVTQRFMHSRARRMRALGQSRKALGRARREGREEPIA